VCEFQYKLINGSIFQIPSICENWHLILTISHAQWHIPDRYHTSYSWISLFTNIIQYS